MLLAVVIGFVTLIATPVYICVLCYRDRDLKYDRSTGEWYRNKKRPRVSGAMLRRS